MQFGETGGARTRDTRLKRPVLCQLSYRPKLLANVSPCQIISAKSPHGTVLIIFWLVTLDN